jgi:hypothetical protein
VSAEITPRLAGNHDVVTLSIWLDVEAPRGPASLSLSFKGSEVTVPEFSGPFKGEDTLYSWELTVESLYLVQWQFSEFRVTVQDSEGVAGKPQLLLDSDGEPLDLRIDLVGPILDDGDALEYSSTVFGIPTGRTADENVLSVDFVMKEWNPPLDTNGQCGVSCPLVVLGESHGGVVSREPYLDDPDQWLWGFRFSREINPADFGGAVEMTLPVVYLWNDLLGNQVVNSGATGIRVDFVRPEAVECLLAPQVAGPSADISYSVTASEPLAAPPVIVKGGMQSPFPEPPEISGDGLTYTWKQSASNLSPGSYWVGTVLTDSAGNESEGTACPATLKVVEE